MDEICDQMLDHRQTLGDEDASSAKMFADPLEGYIGLAGWEVAIVDSPLFQRLRDIRQLGLAYLVYPTLGYTRFEHSLGVVGRLKQVLDHLEENQRLYKPHAEVGELLPEDHRNAVRLAALCHDTGHCIFSHVSEAVMSHLSGHDGYPSASVILKAFHDYAGRSVPPAELLGAAIVASQPFIKFLSNVVSPFGLSAQKARQLAINAAHLIIGLPCPTDSHSLFLAQLLSSGLDVDKLDYMLRESFLAGISLGVPSTGSTRS